MANMELDPVFVRGLRLLHSRSRDSADQLRALLDEVRARAAGGRPSSSSVAIGTSSSRSAPAPLSHRLDAQPSLKRAAEKLRDDIGEGAGGKRSRAGGGGTGDSSPVPFQSHTPSPTLSSRDSDASKKSDDSDLNDTAGLEMDFMNQLACVVCRNMSVGSGNQLIECQDCGNLYHQECHRPPISDMERGDTRSVWRCRDCRESNQPTTASSIGPRLETVSGGVSSALPLVAGAGRPAGTSLLKSKASKSLSSLSSAKSTIPSMPSSIKQSLSQKPQGSGNNGGAGRPIPGSPSSAKVVPSGSALPPPNSMVSAERRMQLMKKKAAAKLNEKRKN